MAEHTHHEQQPSGGGGRGRWVLWGFLLIAGFFLVTEHSAHVFQYLPFLLLAACPLLHMLHGHGSHGGHGGHGEHRRRGDAGDEEAGEGAAQSPGKPDGDRGRR